MSTLHTHKHIHTNETRFICTMLTNDVLLLLIFVEYSKTPMLHNYVVIPESRQRKSDICNENTKHFFFELFETKLLS